ncbi:MAG: zinc-binding alcohol dehydrogenase family protein [Verrucomicrobiota bacterium]
MNPDIAIRLERPGTLAQCNDPLPELKEGEARVRVRQIGVCGTDIHAFHGRQPFFDYPRILGHELAVEIESLNGESVLAPGDVVAVEPYLNDPTSPASRRGQSNCCEKLEVLGVHCDGGMRPHLNVPIRKLLRGEGLAPEQLALVEMLGIGFHAVERARVSIGDKALVIGAGPIGLSVLTFLQNKTEAITVVDLSESRLDFAKEAFRPSATVLLQEGLEAEPAIRDSFGGGFPDVIFDATGNAGSMMANFDRIAHGGRIVFVGLFQGEVRFDDPNFHRREISLLASRNATSPELQEVIGSIVRGDVDTSPWITHRMELSEVPAQFAATIADQGLRKAIISCDS